MFSTLRRLYNFIKWGLAKEGGWMDDLSLLAEIEEKVHNLEHKEQPRLSDLIEDEHEVINDAITEYLRSVNWADELDIVATTEIEVNG